MARGHSRPDLLESDPGSKAEDIGIVNGSLKILVESLADGMIGYENQLSRADQPVGDPVRIANAGIGFARPKPTRGGGQNRGAGG